MQTTKFKNIAMRCYVDEQRCRDNIDSQTKFSEIKSVLTYIDYFENKFYEGFEVFYFKNEQRRQRTLWPELVSEMYRQNDRRLSSKLVSTFADRKWHVVRVMDL
jgi:hypothetical protein